MNVTIKQYASLTVAGLSIETNNQEAKNTIPPLWSRVQSENIIETIPQKLDENVLYGVYGNYASDNTGNYTLLVGTEVQDGTEVQPPLQTMALPLARYVVFDVPKRDAVYAVWQLIWKADLNRTYIADFERYTQDSIEIYIGINEDDQIDKTIISGF